MSQPDLADILKQAQQMQERVGEMQRELARRHFEASSGGGMVTAVVTGQLRVVEVQIEPSLIRDGDREMIQDLTAAAINAALTKAQQEAEASLQRLQGQLTIPGMPGAAGSGGVS